MIALLVIDMQNAYFEAPELAAQQEQLVASCNRLLEGFKAGGHKALMVGTEHERDKSTWTLNMLDDDQGFIFRGSEQRGRVRRHQFPHGSSLHHCHAALMTRRAGGTRPFREK